MARKGNDEARPIIIKRIKKAGGAHHSSAWKVAYADFVTAMMAFFMLLWLLNVTTEEQKSGLADYFAPTTASSSSTSGSGGVLGGTALATDGSMNSGAVVMTMPKPSQSNDGNANGKGEEASAEKVDKEELEWQKAMSERENDSFKEIEAQLRQAIQDSPELSAMAENLVIDIADDGMRIQLIDRDKRAMFKTGTSDLYNYARTILQHIADRIGRTSNRIMITGHTDSMPAAGPAGYSNWELSSDRANSARRVLRSSGIPEDRFSAVRGKAATEPLLPDQPNRPENRRITILLMREAPVMPPKL